MERLSEDKPVSDCCHKARGKPELKCGVGIDGKEEPGWRGTFKVLIDLIWN